ncbi:hypothetical protein SFUL_5533 [Streptomyces microflavus DSM 40593]|uniref:Uncharacterized protein n=1 Tax=Streptomyces microflavus DSM 40593 TaxID=1303692 RepID=N0CWB9_STRMI|nr:hypothetical protein [Streptomyces microflavus]AGK80421.1 hypothetical protein SFUL_5533 [Streptomyces microflavus DSM 40593]
MNTQPTSPCVRHPQAPVIGGMCGGCTVVPSERAVPLLADVPPAVSGVSSEEAATNVTAAVPVLAAVGLPAAEPCTDPRHTGPIRAQLGCTEPAPAAEPTTDGVELPEAAARRFARRLRAVEQLCAGRPGYHTVTVKHLLTAMGEAADDDQEQPLAPVTAADEPAFFDWFTEAAVRRGALLGGADAIAALPQDHELDPGRGDAVQWLRRLALHATVAEQPTGLTWQARAGHAVRLYATTAIERDDLRAENGQLRERLAELEQGQADADALAAEFPDTIAALVEEIADDIPHRRAPQIAANYLARHARLLAEQITTLGQARGWSTWAAEYIHPDREFVDPGKDDDQAEQQLAEPKVGDRYEKRAAPDAGRIVTVSRVWAADSGRTAVAYDWRDDKPGECGSACPIDVFHRTYKAEEQPLTFPQQAGR